MIVVDCYSTADERDRVARISLEHGWEPVLLNENAGFGGGTNAGVDAALRDGADVVIALNPDAHLSTEAIQDLVASAAAHPDALVSPRIISGDGSPWFAGSDLYLDDGTIASSRRREERAGRPRHPWATGACFALSRELWASVGGFDPDYFLYWEDVDLSRRVLDVGGRLLSIDAVVVHDEGQTHADASKHDRRKSETYYYYNIRNRLLYAAKHLEQAGIRQWMRSSPRVSMEILLQGGKGQLLTSLKPWRALWRGLRDGRQFALEAERAEEV
ncbi:glycosyltransferase family 2 protein [Microbacterium jepli]|uniref:glycosyltransferase family 2 protein n=1 Tax=unclassified Microbacterium TaxID=2609290 RepID=UPI0039A121AD